jgi:hypothetical protein
MANLQPFFLGSVVMWIYYILELIGVIVWAMMLVTNAYVSYTCVSAHNLSCLIHTSKVDWITFRVWISFVPVKRDHCR